MIKIYVLDVPEFAPVLAEAKRQGARITQSPTHGYYSIECEDELILNRKAMKMKPAVWYGIFTGGLKGKIAEFGRENVRIVETNL